MLNTEHLGMRADSLNLGRRFGSIDRRENLGPVVTGRQGLGVSGQAEPIGFGFLDTQKGLAGKLEEDWAVAVGRRQGAVGG